MRNPLERRRQGLTLNLQLTSTRAIQAARARGRGGANVCSPNRGRWQIQTLNLLVPQKRALQIAHVTIVDET